MWIERIDFAGFGNVSGEKIEFLHDKLNLIVAQNDSGKSTMATAVWAIPFDFPSDERQEAGTISERQSRRPKLSTGLPYIASIDIVSNGRALKIIRDFDDGSVQVIDRGQNNQDVTGEFLGADGEDEIGLKLTGVSRELFRSTCFVGQRELDENLAFAQIELASMFQGMADPEIPATSEGSAISILEDALNQFPYKGRRAKIDSVIRDLSEQCREYALRIQEMENERCNVSLSLKKLRELNAQVDVSSAPPEANDYFKLCLQAADIDNRLIEAQERVVKVQELRQELARIGPIQGFPDNAKDELEEKWLARQLRFSDFERRHQEIAGKLSECEQAERQMNERAGHLIAFSEKEAQAVGVLAINFQNLQHELAELTKRREAEQSKLNGSDVDFGELESVRKALLGLEPRDYDDARSYGAVMNSAREHLSECELSVWRSRMLVQEIDNERKTKKPLFGLGANSHRKKEMDTAEKDIQKQSELMQELKSKINGLEVRLDALARKANMVDGSELLNRIQDYTVKTGKLKDLDALDQAIAMRQASLAKARADLEPFFNKAGRMDSRKDPDNALELAADAARYIEEWRQFSITFGGIKQARRELDAVEAEISEIDAGLRGIFVRAKLEHLEDVQVSYREFYTKLAASQRRELLRKELDKLENDNSHGSVVEELPRQIERLEALRTQTWSRMKELVESHPEIAETAPPLANQPGSRISVLGENSDRSTNADQQLEDVDKQRDELTIRLRASANIFDQGYISALEEREAAEQDLFNIRRAKSALELARDTLIRLSPKTHVDWSVKLNEISRAMLDNLGLDYKLYFEQDLRLRIENRNTGEQFDSTQIKTQISVGTREQLYWLARMVIARFLSHGNPLPIILDEPFSDSDDDRFLQIMKFLIEDLSRENQVIVFSCHQQRHEWLLSQLNDRQRDMLVFCRHTPLRQGGSAR